MSLYLVVHTPKPEEDEAVVRPPSDLKGLAERSLRTSGPRWLTTWSPDLHDDRVFTLWEAENAAEVMAMIEHYGFLDDCDAAAVRVKEWGPADVIGAGAE